MHCVKPPVSVSAKPLAEALPAKKAPPDSGQGFCVRRYLQARFAGYFPQSRQTTPLPARA
ncbi:MAG: hypothetical protein LBG73_07360 [Spirochaetaceae bacterium]|nr:hypothetical protein [Spirochaetaceae bacterium]